MQQVQWRRNSYDPGFFPTFLFSSIPDGGAGFSLAIIIDPPTHFFCTIYVSSKIGLFSLELWESHIFFFF